MPPKAFIIGAALWSTSAYVFESLSAMSITPVKPRPEDIMTITIGKINRMINTAKIIPTVRNSLCQNGDILSRILLLMTALSKLNVTSRISKTINTHNPAIPI